MALAIGGDAVCSPLFIAREGPMTIRIPLRVPTLLCAALLAACGSGSEAGKQAQAAEPQGPTEEQKTLYALGAALGENLKAFALTPEEVKSVQDGFADAAVGKELEVPMAEYMPKVQVLHGERQAKVLATEKEAGAAYLAKAAAESGAVKTPSGIVIIPMTAGTGASPKASDTVKVHYHGTLINGEVFDSSVQRGEPVDFPLNAVVPCWTEGVQQIKVGGKSKLICPPELAYGDRGSPPRIRPGSTLVFEVELLDISK
jgi:FKBP-type peptidyl-prolyl cis-trans isomerase FkpA